MTDKKKHDEAHDEILQPEVKQDEAAHAEVVNEQVATETDPLRAARDEIADLKDKLLRTHAEMENLRRRTQREVEDARKFGVEKLATALLEVVDNLERALAAEAGNEAALRDGVQMTLDSWRQLMNRFHLERIDAVGEAFDPHRHEALSQMPSDEHPEGTVVAQHVAGYTLHGRLIRPAKVLVSSGPAE